MRQQFEFRHVAVNHNSVALTVASLNALGSEGWAVVASLALEGNTHYILLQRPKLPGAVVDVEPQP